MDFGWFHDDEAGLSELNITPLVDVALVLLIIFMITAPMLVQGANVNLPRTRPMNKLPSGNIFITVDAECQNFLNDDPEPVAIDDLEERLVPLVELGQSVFVRGDEAARYGCITDIMDAAVAAGVEGVNVVTAIKPPDSR